MNRQVVFVRVNVEQLKVGDITKCNITLIGWLKFQVLV